MACYCEHLVEKIDRVITKQVIFVAEIAEQFHGVREFHLLFSEFIRILLDLLPEASVVRALE